MKHSSRFPLLSLTAALLLALTAGGSWGEEDGVCYILGHRALFVQNHFAKFG